MSLNDSLANMFSQVLSCERIGRDICTVKPVSKTMKKVLDIMKEKKYIGSYDVVEDGRGGFLKINLLGKINNCGVVKPRFAVKNKEIEKFEKRFLPAKSFGILLIATNKGITTNQEIAKKNIGGKVLGYCY
ncbi:30S ribosomal protein S8 [Candidatus Woesearchaeota archaeon]|nr:30S ribosomal protein S8 [Candidatus Woesearchaeota archaeon]